MKDVAPDKVAAFLKELSALTRRYKIGIAGCGCCGSPFLTFVRDTKGRAYAVSELDDGLSFQTKGQALKRD